MRLLLDQDVYDRTRRFLLQEGHDLVTAAELGMSRAEDLELLRLALREERLLVTRDRDFGRLALKEEATPGILYLRMRPSAVEAVHEELRGIFESHAGFDLVSCFTVVEPGRHRIRRRLV